MVPQTLHASGSMEVLENEAGRGAGGRVVQCCCAGRQGCLIGVPHSGAGRVAFAWARLLEACAALGALLWTVKAVTHLHSITRPKREGQGVASQRMAPGCCLLSQGAAS